MDSTRAPAADLLAWEEQPAPPVSRLEVAAVVWELRPSVPRPELAGSVGPVGPVSAAQPAFRAAAYLFLRQPLLCLGRTKFEERYVTQRRGFNHIDGMVSTTPWYVTQHTSAKENRITTGVEIW